MTDRTSTSSLYPIVSLGGTSLGLGLSGYLTITRWLEPLDPILMVGGGVGVLLLCLNGLVAFYHQSERASWRAMLQSPLVWSLVSAGIGMAMASVWSMSDVRTSVLQRLPQKAYGASGGIGADAAPPWRETEMAALLDPATSVASNACRRIVSAGTGLQRQTLLDRLEARPPVARACLTSFDSPDAEGRSTALELSRVLQHRWFRTARNRASDQPKRACRTLDPVLGVPEPGSTGVPALLHCAIGDEVPSAFRSCCARQLVDRVGGGAALASALRGPIDGELARQLAAPLMRASVHRIQLTSEERERYATLDMEHPEMQRFAIRMGCNLVETDGDRSLVDQFNAWIQRDRCRGDADALRNNLPEWQNLCRRVTPAIETTEQPARRLCSMADAHLHRLAIDQARSELHGAIGGGLRSMWESGIKSGVRMEQLEQSSPGALKESMKRLFEPGSDDTYESFIRSRQDMDAQEALRRFGEQQAERLEESTEALSEARESPRTDDSSSEEKTGLPSKEDAKRGIERLKRMRD